MLRTVSGNSSLCSIVVMRTHRKYQPYSGPHSILYRSIHSGRRIRYALSCIQLAVYFSCTAQPPCYSHKHISNIVGYGHRHWACIKWINSRAFIIQLRIFRRCNTMFNINSLLYKTCNAALHKIQIRIAHLFISHIRCKHISSIKKRNASPINTLSHKAY